VIDAFLAAARAGDFEALLEVLDPEVVFRTHGRAVARPPAVGAGAVARRILARGRRSPRTRDPRWSTAAPGWWSDAAAGFAAWSRSR
jgi:hypothetical protein